MSLNKHFPENTNRSSPYWRRLGEDLGIEVYVDSFVIGLENIGRVDAVLPSFGGANGMIVVNDFDQIEAFLAALNESGYGFSTFLAEDKYNRDDAIELLRDWGWTGNGKPPEWLGSKIDANGAT